MGGKSQGYVSYSTDPNDTMTFYGTINTNGGGFANVGLRFSPPLDLTPYAGIVVEMEADGWSGVGGGPSSNNGEKPFGFHLQLGDNGWYGFSSAFAVPLAREDGMRTTGVYLPLASFNRGTRMGWQCTSCKLDTTQINEMEIYALFQEGSFRIDVKSITAVTDPKSFGSPSITFRPGDVEALIEATIASGSKGEICVAIYWSTLNTILEAVGISDAIKGVACAGVQRVDPYGDTVENALNLRSTLDAVLADVKGVQRNENSPAWLPSSNGFGVLEEGCRGYTSIHKSPEPTPSPVGAPTKVTGSECSTNQKVLQVRVKTDMDSNDTRFNVKERNEKGKFTKNILKSGKLSKKNKVHTFSTCVDNRSKCYKLKIRDMGGNGIKDGFVQLFVNDYKIYDDTFSSGNKRVKKFGLCKK